MGLERLHLWLMNTTSRREFLSLGTAAIALAVAGPVRGADRREILPSVAEQIICPWTPENPRHDHQLIFPLSGGRLLFVWCEYYASRPSLVRRKPTSKSGQAGDEMPCRIMGRVSDDLGRTWGPRFAMQDNLWQHNVKHPNLVRLPGGEILFFFVGWDSQDQRNLFLKRSGNEGETWSEIQQVSEPGWLCANNDHALTLKNGRVIVPVHGPDTGKTYLGGESKLHSFVYYSDDGFQTWRRSRNSMTAPDRGAHEPAIVELRDGRLLAFLRTRTGRIWQSWSEDQGETWSPSQATELKAPDSPPLLKRIPSTGDLLLLWNNVESRSNWPRTPLTSAISRDEGKTWVHLQDVDNRPDFDAAYASVHFAGEEALVAYYTRPTRWARDSEVTLKIFKVDDFYAG